MALRKEILDNLRQAEEDLKSAKFNLAGERYYVCIFLSQQAAEKGLKALFFKVKGRNIFIHNLADLGRSLGAPKDVLEAAKKLTPAYTITRYVDAANGVPADLFNKKDAQVYLSSGETVLKWVKQKLK